MLKSFAVVAFFASLTLCCGQIPAAGNVPPVGDELVVAKVPKLPAIDGKADDDACTLGFELEGKFDSDMKAGIESKWDVWEWGAARTNPSGYALDRTHVYSKTAPTPPLKGRRLTTRDSGQIYFSHPVDEGTPC